MISTHGSFRALVVLLAAVLSACAGPPGERGGSCSVSDNGDGTATIACEDGTRVTVTQGREGGQGPAGDAGTSCTLQSRADGGRAIVCSDGTMTDIPTGTACTVSPIDGGRLISCSDGTSIPVLNGTNGTNGTNASPDLRDAFRVEKFHGTDVLEAEELAASGRALAHMTITSATASAAGQVVVNFRVTDRQNVPVRTIAAVQANIAKLLPGASTSAPDGGPVTSRWVPYLWRQAVVSDAGVFPNPAGTRAWQPSREGSGQLVNNGDGTYQYTFATDLSNIAPDGGQHTSYERSRLHRVAVMIGGHDGPTADAWLDFVPDGTTPAPATRRLIDTSNCRTCHGEEFRAHGGDRLTVEVCATCHVPDAYDPESGNSIDLQPMIHKIHAGAELQSIPGPNGIVFDNPATTIDESADNGQYALWGYQNVKHTWWKAQFPAVIANCTKCHNDRPNPGSLPQLTNWKDVPSRAACGSCHDLVNFATGAGHAAGPVPNDNACAVCHPASGTPSRFVVPVEQSHDWTDDDPRNVPEFTIDMSVNTPSRGYFTSGEAPVVTMVIRSNGAPIDHTTFLQDIDGAEGCLAAGCPPGDGKFAASNFFVHGPRGDRNPVLTMAARTRLQARSAGPFDLGAADAGVSMTFVVDNGEDLRRELDLPNNPLARGTITVTPPAGGFVNRNAATAQEIATWLNSTAAFSARALAYIDEQTGLLAVRSRNLGKLYAIQVLSGTLASTLFNDFTVKSLSGYFPSNTIARAWLADGGVPPATAQDPKVTYATGSVSYQLDPVTDLAPGTYFASVEFRDRGGVNTANYKTPSVARVQFQVKQLAEELPPARNCNTCHGSPENDRGLVFDFYRHYKVLSDDKAVDQCGACHDSQNSNVTGAWGGAGAISRRVHAVHAGSTLNSPLLTVGYSNGDPVAGRNWDIAFTQNLRNCQVCHPDTTSSGTWKTRPSRLPCGGCHDSSAATAHMNIMTSDPTPAAPFSGDESESCQTCH